jgi:hypothetical protein
VRHNYVDGFNDIGGSPTSPTEFPSNFYRQHSKTNSTVGQLNSRLRHSVNEFRATYQRIRDFRSTSRTSRSCSRLPRQPTSTSGPRTRRTPTNWIRTRSSSTTTTR